MQRLAYDAYGRVTQDTAPGAQPFGFKGSLSDPLATGAGLVWMGVRAYLPAIGRFTTVDSAGLLAGWNQHDALGSDPINMVDADGRFAIPVPIPLPGGPFSGPNPGLQSMVQDAWNWATDWAEWGRAGKRLIDLCVDPIHNAINRAGEAVDGDGDGDGGAGGFEDHSGETQSKSDPKKVARDLGLTKKQVEDAIHDLKRGLSRGGGSRDNPDVWVDKNGEAYPLGPGNVTGDSLGNIRDVL